LLGWTQETSMPDSKKKPTPQETELELWARALGVSPQRLMTLVDEVVKERLLADVSLVPAKVLTTQ
jgi:hypothetical protein